jgi:hypothetical protein
MEGFPLVHFFVGGFLVFFWSGGKLSMKITFKKMALFSEKLKILKKSAIFFQLKIYFEKFNGIPSNLGEILEISDRKSWQELLKIIFINGRSFLQETSRKHTKKVLSSTKKHAQSFHLNPIYKQVIMKEFQNQSIEKAFQLTLIDSKFIRYPKFIRIRNDNSYRH